MTRSSYVLSVRFFFFLFVPDKDHLKDLVISSVTSIPQVGTCRVIFSNHAFILIFFSEFVNYVGA